MTEDEWATICTIHQEPAYLFVREERRVAERMAKLGWLAERPSEERVGRKYTVTILGERIYKCEQKGGKP